MLGFAIAAYRSSIAKPLPLTCRWGEAAFNDGLEEVPDGVPVPEPPVPVARKGRMIRHLAIQTKLAEPPIGEVQVHLLTQPARSERVQHSDHQFRINRRAGDRAVE